MRLRIKLLSPEHSKFYNVKKNYESDSGFDLYSIKNVTIEPWKVGTIEFGIAAAPFLSNENDRLSGYYLYPRSSISKTPLMLANSVGIIDYSYRGPILAKVRNLSDEPYTVTEGTSLFQLCSPNLEPFNEIILVDNLDNTQRGSCGFGSTN